MKNGRIKRFRINELELCLKSSREWDWTENSAERPQTCFIIGVITGFLAFPSAMSYFKDILLGKRRLNASLFHFIIICPRCWRGENDGHRNSSGALQKSVILSRQCSGIKY